MAEEEKKEAEGKGAEGGEGKPKSSLPVVIGIIAGVVILQAVMLFVFMTVTKPKDPEVERQEAVKDSLAQVQQSSTSVGKVLEVPLEAVVNIAGTDGGRFLKIIVKAAYDSERASNKNLEAELLKREVVFKNILIDQLSALTLPELQDVDAKTAIRKEFKRRVNNSLPTEAGEISDVYIVEFIIQ